MAGSVVRNGCVPFPFFFMPCDFGRGCPLFFMHFYTFSFSSFLPLLLPLLNFHILHALEKIKNKNHQANSNLLTRLIRGLEADQKVLAAHGCYAMTATTALTVQNTTGVKAIHVVPADFVGEQIEACFEDVGVDVVKTGSSTIVFFFHLEICCPLLSALVGMLAAAATIEMVAKQVVKHSVSSLVVDPVRRLFFFFFLFF